MNTILLAVTGPIAAIGAWLALRNRIALSRAKHRSLSGHARLSQRLAKLLPFYEYGESADLRSRTARRPISWRDAGSGSSGWRIVCPMGRLSRSRPPTSSNRACRISSSSTPIVFRSSTRAYVRKHLKVGVARAGVIGGPRPQSRRPPGVRSHRLLRRECVRVRLLQGVHRRRHRARSRSGSGARLVSPGRRRQRPETAGRFPAWTKCRSTCPAPKR